MQDSVPGLPVLIVEDNPIFLDLIFAAVKSLNMSRQTLPCRCGAEALDLIEQPGCRLGLALIDLGLPDVSGIDLIRVLRKRFTQLPIMVISVITSERTVLEAIRAGARGYILKSDSEPAIAAAIREVLEGNYPISPSLARTLFKLAGAPAAGEGGQVLKLSPRERETLQCLARGHSYAEVASLMGVALSTVQSNIRNLYRKLDASSQIQAINKARDAGLI